MAWRDIDTQHRDALHQPINCKLHLYHTHAGLIMGSALECLTQELSELLNAEA